MVLTVSFAISPVIGLSCHRRLANWQRVRARLGRHAFAKLDASVEASGPRDFAVRISAVRLRAAIAHGKPPCDLDCAPALPRPPHPEPNVRDDRETPLMWAGTARLMELIWVK